MPAGIWQARSKAARGPAMYGAVSRKKELLHTSHDFQMSSGNVRARGSLPSAQSEPENYEG